MPVPASVTVTPLLPPGHYHCHRACRLAAAVAYPFTGPVTVPFKGRFRGRHAAGTLAAQAVRSHAWLGDRAPAGVRAHPGCAVCGVAVAVPIAGHLLIPEVAEGTLSPMRIACQTFAGGVAQHSNEACRSRCRKCPACSTWCRMWAVRNRPPTQLVTTIQRPSTSWSRSATPEPTVSRMTFFSGIPMRCCQVPGPLALFAAAKTTGAPLIVPPAGIGRFAALRTGARGGIRVLSRPCKRYHLEHAALP